MTYAVPKLLCLTSLLLAVSAAAGQTDPSQDPNQPAPIVVPLYTTFRVPTINGTLRYSASASEILTFGYNGTNDTASALSLSGNVGYLSSSTTHPFSLTYSGGYIENTIGSHSNWFHTINVMQTVTLERWTLNIGDSLRYTPDTPSTGLSGIPGLGDIGTITVPPETQGVLTQNTPQLTNDVSGSVSRKLTGRTDLHASGDYATLRFVNDSQALKPDTITASGGIGHTISARTSISVNYNYEQFTYAGTGYSASAEGLTAGIKRQLTRKLSVTASAGPQRINASSFTGLPANYNYEASVQLSYTLSNIHPTSLGLGYSRATTAGAGVTLGAITDTAGFTVARSLTKELQVSAQVAYDRSEGLQIANVPQYTSQAVVASGQINRSLTRTLSAYASYSLQRQIASGVVQGIAPINGVIQTIGFGVTYSPQPIRLGRK